MLRTTIVSALAILALTLPAEAQVVIVMNPSTPLADVVVASGQHHKAVQEAKILREVARQSSLDTAKKRLELEDWAARYRPSATKMIAQQRALELRGVRNGPSVVDIRTGHAMNVLLHSILLADGDAMPVMAMDAKVLAQINVTAASAWNAPSVLKYGAAKLAYPEVLDRDEFAAPRKRFDENLDTAISALRQGATPASAVLKAIRADVDEMEKTLAHLTDQRQIGVQQGVQGTRFIRTLKIAVAGLYREDAHRHFDGSYAVKSENLAQLLTHMAKNGLVFAPAGPGEDQAYNILFHAIRDCEREVVVKRGK